MVQNRYNYLSLLIAIIAFCTQTVWCATLTVTTLLDDNSPGSLRTIIATATSGDTIEFGVAGTINLDPVKGELFVDTMLTIDGGDHITIDGSNAIATCFHISSSDASETIITNITIHNFQNLTFEGSAHGILIDNGANGCSVINCTIAHITGGQGEDALGAGILASDSVDYTGSLRNNTIRFISSADIDNMESGNVAGIFLFNALGQAQKPAHCSNNIISDLTSAQPNLGPTFGVVTGITIFSLNGTCNNNKLSNFYSADKEQTSGNVIGIFIFNATGHCSNNSIEQLQSGQTFSNNFTSGRVAGIDIINPSSLIVHNNIIHTLVSGDSNGFSGSVTGITFFSLLSGNCVNNTITNLASGMAHDVSGTVHGINMSGGLSGSCSNNVIKILTSGLAEKRSAAIGIIIENNGTESVENKHIRCNTIVSIVGGGHTGSEDFLAKENTSGIWLRRGHNYVLAFNTITQVQGQTEEPVHGILLGDDTEQNLFAYNNCIQNNSISHIFSQNNLSFGITIENPASLGNDILNNSIFDIETKAINITNNGVQTDAKITLTSVRSADGYRLLITGRVVPFIQAPLFKVQFFVSDSSMPEQTQIFIGEYIHDTTTGTAFETSLSQLPTIQTGQFITATATALINPNNNTSEVSNALVTRQPFTIACPRPPALPIPPVPCPTTDCDNLLL